MSKEWEPEREHWPAVLLSVTLLLAVVGCAALCAWVGLAAAGGR